MHNSSIAIDCYKNSSEKMTSVISILYLHGQILKPGDWVCC